jgi:hypothetical protein
MPALPKEAFNLSGFSPEEETRLNALWADEDFQEAVTQREQIGIACKHLRAFREGRRFTFEAIGRFFGGFNPGTIERQFKLSREDRKSTGRPALLSEEIKQWMMDLITSRFAERKPITYAEIVDLLQYQHNLIITADSLRHIIRDMEGIKSIIGIPMEAERVAVDPTEIEAWFRELAIEVAGIPRAFVLNVDETGCSDCSDKREVRVVAPIDYPEPSVPVPYDRHSKRSTLVACIAADGFRLKPFVIVHRATAEKELKYYGYDESNVILTAQENAFMTCSLFELWADRVFFPGIEARRQQFDYQGPVLLLLDGLGSHHTDNFLQQCANRNIKVKFLVPHSSDQTQPLDLLTFALMKQRFSSSKFCRLSNAQSNKVVRMLGAWFAASAPHHNVEAFMTMGLIPEIEGEIFYLRVDMEHARLVRGGQVAEAPLPAVAFGPDGQRRFRHPNGH